MSVGRAAGFGVLRTAVGAVVHCGAQYELVIPAGEEPAITGRILNPPRGGFPLEALATPLILELEDGREWQCSLATTSGLLVNRGHDVLR